jgi:hypothetical protein
MENVGRPRRFGALIGGIVLALLPGPVSAKSSPPVGGSDECGWRVTREYGPEELTYRLHLSLGGCPWWDGSTRSVKITVTRAGQDGARTARSSPGACAMAPAERQRSGNAQCDATAAIPHPEGETAHYRGEAAWKWNDGPHRVTFDTTCTTTSESVSCADDTGAASS